MEITRVTEFEISQQSHLQIQELYNLCFAANLDRSYFKQLPHFRYLVFQGNNLIAQMGVDHRVIKVGNSIYSIFGIIDLCVDLNYRRQGIASRLLNLLTELDRENSIDFLFAISHSDRLYIKNGFQAVFQPCSWLGIDEHQNCGVITQTIEENIMIKQIGDRPWQNRAIDLLGYMF